VNDSPEDPRFKPPAHTCIQLKPLRGILIPMSRGKSKKYRSYLDLHTAEARELAIIIGLGLLMVLSLLVRKSLIHFQNPDYQTFSSWYDFVKAHGLHSFKYVFSNYNPPYTYFLYIATKLPVAKIVAIKFSYIRYYPLTSVVG